MSVEQTQDTIQAYLEGRMSAEALRSFEAQIQADPALAEEVHRCRQLRVMTRHEALLQGKQTLAAIMAEVDITPDYGQHRRYFDDSGWFKRWIPSLLALVALVSGGTWYYGYQQQQETLARVQSVLEPLDNIIGFSPDDPGSAAAGMRAYDQRNYPEAIRYLSTAAQESQDDPSLQLYLAVSYLLQQEPTRAEPLLRPLTQTDALLTIPARWYLAVCLLQQGKTTEATPLLDGLKEDVVYGEKVRRVRDGG